MNRRLINIRELAEYLGMSINTIRSWVWLRKIPYFRMGKLIRFDLCKIEKWLKDREVLPLK